MVFSRHINHYISDILDPILTSYHSPLLGGVYPSIIYDCKNADSDLFL